MVLCVGNFNDKCMTWDGDHSESEMDYKFYNYNNDTNFFQLVEEPTRVSENGTASLLDLILTDSPGYMDLIGTLPPLSDLDHSVIYGFITFVDYRPAKIKREVWYYNRADFELIRPGIYLVIMILLTLLWTIIIISYLA